jgi:paraquat-inducible protein A
MKTALEQGLAVCLICLATNPCDRRRCERCRGSLHARTPRSIQRTVALGLAAMALYVPANVLPIMITDQFGQRSENTIICGVLELWDLGSYPVAVVILIASVLIPLGKLAALAFLCWAATRMPVPSHGNSRQLAALYRTADLVGKWSMVDVFVVALLVALIQLGGVISVRPGTAALAFSSVVILTMLAVESFDPRLMWDRQAHGRE